MSKKDLYYEKKYLKYLNKYNQLAGRAGFKPHNCHCLSCIWYKGKKQSNGTACGCDCHCQSKYCAYKLFSWHCGVCRDKGFFDP